MRRFYQLQLMSGMLCLSVLAMRHHRDSRALGYVPPFLPGLNRVTIDPAIRYEELVLDETRLQHNAPPKSQNLFEWNDKDAGYYSKLSTVRRDKDMSNPWLYFQSYRPQFQTTFGGRHYRTTSD